MMLKRSPLGSSFVIITPFWRIEIGKMLGGGGNSSATVGSRGVCVRDSAPGDRARCIVNFPRLNRIIF